MFCIMIAIMSSDIMTNKSVCKIKQSILYLTFLNSEFVDIVFVIFVNGLSVALKISSQNY